MGILSVENASSNRLTWDSLGVRRLINETTWGSRASSSETRSIVLRCSCTGWASRKAITRVEFGCCVTLLRHSRARSMNCSGLRITCPSFRPKMCVFPCSPVSRTGRASYQSLPPCTSSSARASARPAARSTWRPLSSFSQSQGGFTTTARSLSSKDRGSSFVRQFWAVSDSDSLKDPNDASYTSLDFTINPPEDKSSGYIPGPSFEHGHTYYFHVVFKKHLTLFAGSENFSKSIPVVFSYISKPLQIIVNKSRLELKTGKRVIKRHDSLQITLNMDTYGNNTETGTIYLYCSDITDPAGGKYNFFEYPVKELKSLKMPFDININDKFWEEIGNEK